MTTTIIIDRDNNIWQGSSAMDSPKSPDPEVPEHSLGRRRFSPKYKAKILEEYKALDKSQRGAMLRREGLYSSLIIQLAPTAQPRYK